MNEVAYERLEDPGCDQCQMHARRPGMRLVLAREGKDVVGFTYAQPGPQPVQARLGEQPLRGILGRQRVLGIPMAPLAP
jgi:hypothetical protein